jgi:hypothetical protein
VAEIIRFLEANFDRLFGFALLWVVAWVVYFAWRRHNSGPMHPPYAEQDVRFTERFVSGFSHKNLFTRFGGGNNALVVRVLKDALLIEPVAVFKWITPAGFNDLEHYVPKRDILDIEVVPSFGRARFRIRFRARDGSPRTVELMLRRSQEFQSALNALAA